MVVRNFGPASAIVAAALMAGLVGCGGTFTTLAELVMAAKKQVAMPMKVTKVSVSGAASNMGDRRQTMNTPAVTIVAAWIRADTGVGPSIASGSQTCSGNWADFPMAPQNTPIPARVRSCPESFPSPMARKTSSYPRTPQVA